MSQQVRVRFAPSPTGLMHIGTARTALFTWLYSKSVNGKFILRIEDTDTERSKPEFEENIISGLKWLGIEWDEFYRQSERIEIYKEYLKKLLDENKAYYCFCSEEQLEGERQSMLAQGIAPKYSGRCRSLKDTEVKEKLSSGESSVIRFKTPEAKVSFNDIIRGKITFDTGLIGDIVIAKSLSAPLYNFAVVIDDELMKITHVIRGEDHLSNTPKQIVLAEAFGFSIPEFAHLPIILNPDRSKMSKRFSDTALSDYIKNGYLKEAITNFLTFLGWHPKENKEVMNVPEVIKEFDLARVQKAGAVFNVEKLNWLNSYYLGKKDSNEILELSRDFLPSEWRVNESMIDSVKGRAKTLSELKDLLKFYFEPNEYEAELLKFKDMKMEDVSKNLEGIAGKLNELSQDKFNVNDLQVAFEKEMNLKNRGEVLWPLRVALSYDKVSPGPFEIMAALGREESIKRINFAITKSKNV